MDNSKNLNFKQLEKTFLEVDAELRALRGILDYLEQENKHLRQVIEMLITSKPPTI